MVSDGAIVEHDVWLYKDVKGGVLAHQCVYRHYEGRPGRSTEVFIRAIPAAGSKAMRFMATHDLPRPKGYER